MKKTKLFSEIEGWVLAGLIAATIGVLALSLHLLPELGGSVVLPLVLSVLGIFLSAVGLQFKKQNLVCMVALVSILLSAYGYLDGLRSQQQGAALNAEHESCEARAAQNDMYAKKWERNANMALERLSRCLVDGPEGIK